MPLRDIYEIGYSTKECRRKAAFWIIIATFSSLVVFGYLAKEDPQVFVFSLIFGPLAAYLALTNLWNLIFHRTRLLITISADGIRDTRLRPQFIPWSTIETIEPSKPTLLEKLSSLPFIVVSIFSPSALSYGATPEKDRITLRLRKLDCSPGALPCRISIETKDLAISSERLAYLIDVFHKRYAAPTKDA